MKVLGDNYPDTGGRVRKNNLFGEIYFIYDEQGSLLAEADSNGKILKEYVYFDNQPLAMLIGE